MIEGLLGMSGYLHICSFAMGTTCPCALNLRTRGLIVPRVGLSRSLTTPRGHSAISVPRLLVRAVFGHFNTIKPSFSLHRRIRILSFFSIPSELHLFDLSSTLARQKYYSYMYARGSLIVNLSAIVNNPS